MSTSSQQTNARRWLLPFLAAMVAALAAILLGTTASASAAVGAETRVGAFNVAGEVLVEPPQDETAGQHPGRAEESAETVVATGVAAKSGDEAFHYTSSKWIDSITKTGLNKGSYATPNGSLSPLQASLELALPPNRALPDAALRIDLAGLRRAGYEIPSPTRVSSTVSSGGRTYSMPGGGYEMQFPYAIPPEFIKVVPR